MAQLTLLDMTQSILSALNSDEVNSISDTVESMQIARIIKNKYYDIVARSNLPEQTVLIQLDAPIFIGQPVLMTIPSGVVKINWIKYFDSTDSTYKYVTIIPIGQLLEMTDKFNPADSNIGSMDFLEGGNAFLFYYKNDAHPNYCTIIENHYVIFDSHNSALETTLRSGNTEVSALKVTAFSLTDGFIPDLDDEKFPLLLNESKALAFYEMKQIQHPLAQQEIKRQWVTSSKNNSVVNKPSHFAQLPDFGRRTRVGSVNRWMREK